MVDEGWGTLLEPQSFHPWELETGTGVVEVTMTGVEQVVEGVVDTTGLDQSPQWLLWTTGVVDVMTMGLVVVEVMTIGIDGVVDGFQSDHTVVFVSGMGTGDVLVMMGTLAVVHGVSPP